MFLYIYIKEQNNNYLKTLLFSYLFIFHNKNV